MYPFFDSYDWSDNILCVCAACCNARTDSESVFNPFEVDSDHSSNIFDDSMYDVLTTADSILSNCKCRPINELQVYDNTFSTLYFHNIDGFKSNFHESLINIKSINYSPSILSFYETNLKRDDPEDYLISGYNSEHLYAISDKNKGSGISLYYNKTHLFNRISSLDIRNNYFECMGGRLKTENTYLYIIIVYHYHGNDAEFSDRFMEVIEDYKEKPLVILGDFNIDLLSYNTDPNTDKYANAIISNSLFPLVNKPTNFFRNSSTLIDHAWCNILNEKTQATILDISVSTHKPVLTVIPTALEHFVDDSATTDRKIRIHNVNDSTTDSFSKEFDNIVSSFNHNDDPIVDKDKVRLAFSEFYTKLDSAHRKHITIDKVLKSKRNKFDKPWITTGLAISCKTKNRLHYKWIKSRGTTTENVRKVEYKNYRSKLRNLIRVSEINYFKSKFTNSCGDIKKAWSVINSIRCKKKSTKFPSFSDVNGTIITSRRSICSEFNNYFVNVADKLNKSKYTTIQPHDFKQFLSNPSSSSIFLSSITSAEIIDIINKLDSRKSNNISPKLLKALSSSFSNALSYLFNSCMLSGIFPDELKIAKVIPLYKSGSSNLVFNYRPISILPTLSKIFEKLIHSRIYQFLEENQVIYNCQFGFRQSHSTIHAVQTTITSVVSPLNDSRQSMGIFVDFSKAFDTIKHEILLSKLNHYRIRGIALELICDYLSNRKQFFFYDNDCYSILSDISIGVPQGSVLGPLLFIIYVNDIISCMDDSSNIILFADDTNIFVSASTIEELYDKANMILLKLKKLY